MPILLVSSELFFGAAHANFERGSIFSVRCRTTRNPSACTITHTRFCFPTHHHPLPHSRTRPSLTYQPLSQLPRRTPLSLFSTRAHIVCFQRRSAKYQCAKLHPSGHRDNGRDFYHRHRSHQRRDLQLVANSSAHLNPQHGSYPRFNPPSSFKGIPFPVTGSAEVQTYADTFLHFIAVDCFALNYWGKHKRKMAIRGII